jgi:fibronectin type III domain-containing protein 3
VATASLSYSITSGLVTGDTYRFRVKALNEAGYGPYSYENSVVAATVPDVPSEFSLLASSPTTINFEWTAPYDGGSPITYYKVYWDDARETAVFSLLAFTVGPDTNFIINSGLTTGLFY